MSPTITLVDFTMPPRYLTSLPLTVGMSALPVFLSALNVLSSLDVFDLTVCSQVRTEPQKTETHFFGVAFRVEPAATPLRTRASSKEAVTAMVLVVDLKRVLSFDACGRLSRRADSA